MYASLLEMEGASVLSAGDVNDALRILRVFVPDLVITDIAMPGRSGTELLNYIRNVQVPSGRNLPVIAATGYLKDGISPPENGDFDEFILKPVDHENLIRAMQRLLSRQRGSGPGGDPNERFSREEN